jgi:predicted GTPase
MNQVKVVIMGAAGRDFHNFNVVFRQDPRYRVVAFTAAQIPNIAGRRYPCELAGPAYPDGIPVQSESELDSLIRDHGVHQVVFAYSDVPHEEVMHKAALALACGAEFRILGPGATMLKSNKPVVSVCAVRTGCGKSPVSRKVTALLLEEGLRVVVVRHPMPYGDLSRQTVQRFASMEDLDRAACTIEELEEYEPHIRNGSVVYAGVDYERILRQAEGEADILVWDGGNNDWPFYCSDLEIVLVDPHRAGHERSFFPGEVNLRRAGLIVLTKLDSASAEQTEQVRRSVRQWNAHAPVIESTMPITVTDPDRLRGRRVLIVEDGPTLTHGGMGFGAGMLAARRYGAGELVDPRPFAVGSIKETFESHPQIGPVLPAVGYSAAQMRDLSLTIEAAECDLVLIATPVDLACHIPITKPTCRVSYSFEEIGRPTLREVLEPLIRTAKAGA